MNRTLKDNIFKYLYLSCAIFGIAAVILISVFLFARGIPSIMEIGLFKFLFGTKWNPTLNQFGILPMIVNSLYVTAFAVAIGVGIGVFSAVFMSKFCPKRIYRFLKNVINLLAGIPSVVYGFFGMQVIVPMFAELSTTGVGYGVAASGIILGIMILPTVISVSLNSLNNVPQNYYEGAVSLGSTHEQAVFKVMVPAAKNGIMTGVILGIGRAIGETMAVVMVSGNVPKFAESLFQSIRTLTGGIVVEMSYAEGLHLGALIGIGVVLFIFILLITLCLNIFNSNKKKVQKNMDEIKNTSKVALALKLDKISYHFNTFKNKLILAKNNFMFKVNAVIHSKTRTKGLRTGALTLKYTSFICVGVTILSLVSIVLFILVKGVPHLSLDLVFGKFEYGGAVTLLPSIVTTLMLVFLTIVICVPIGVCCAIYLVEYTKKGNKLVKFIRGAVETLAGIPSIIYGLFGMIFFSGILGMGYSIIAGCLTLVLMILPTIIRTTEQSLLEVPDSFREGSLALGASKTRTIFKVILPSAISGIITGIILSIGRIVGESAVVLFTVGSTKSMPTGFGSSGISLSVFMYILAGEGFHVNEAYATAVVLLIIVLLLNGLSGLVEMLYKRRKGNDKVSKKAKNRKKVRA